MIKSAVKRKICIGLMLFFVLPFLFCGCGENKLYESNFFALDTVIALKSENEAAMKKAEDLVRKYEKILSATDSESELYKINNGQKKTVSPEFEKVFREAVKVSENTNGAYNFAIYPLILEWGFTTKNYNIPKNDRILKLLSQIDFTKIKISDNMINVEDGVMMDFGGIAKGFICDETVKLLRSEGCENALISMGGNVHAMGDKNGKMWQVGIKNPFGEGYSGILKVSDKAVVTSGGYERFFEKDGSTYHHIIDPETGYPAESDIASVTIVSESGTMADGYSTALFVMGFEKAKEFYKTEKNFDAVFILENGEIYITEGIEKDFSAEKFEVIY